MAGDDQKANNRTSTSKEVDGPTGSGQNDTNLYGYTFEIKGEIPSFAVDVIRLINEFLEGLGGHLVMLSPNSFRLYFEGPSEVVEKARDVFVQLFELIKDKAQIIVNKLEMLTELTCEEFSVNLKDFPKVTQFLDDCLDENGENERGETDPNKGAAKETSEPRPPTPLPEEKPNEKEKAKEKKEKEAQKAKDAAAAQKAAKDAAAAQKAAKDAAAKDAAAAQKAAKDAAAKEAAAAQKAAKDAAAAQKAAKDSTTAQKASKEPPAKQKPADSKEKATTTDKSKGEKKTDQKKR